MIRSALVRALLTVGLLGGSLVPPAAPPRDLADELLAAMTPEERVGQLFLIGFDGPRPSQAVLDLIRRGYVSGVVLRAANDNFTAAPTTLADAEALIDSLQAARLQQLEAFVTPQPPDEPSGGVYVPLFVGISLNREGSPYPEILEGLSEPVTAMALGATWDPSLARDVGEQVGRELAALGFNLFLGPSLDVLDETSQRSPGDLGTEGFGGDPFWVSRMGQAYVAGLHAGSDGGAAVVAKHFPGTGSSDRSPSEEVATVRKSLEGLRLVDLAPFVAVTSGVPGTDGSTVDGLLLSHLRYQGLQGSIRQTTRPVSLDRAAVEQILGLDTLPAWRAAGGLIVSDSLGSRAVRRFYDPSERTFNGPLVAREAFQAGSDLLLLDDFVSSDDAEPAATIRKTVEAFSNRYRDDTLFAEQVDAAALRVLRLKLRLYRGAFDPLSTSRRTGSESIRPSGALAFRVARAAATRISPPGALSGELLGLVPSARQRIVVFTDVLPVRQCSGCAAAQAIPVTALAEKVNDLYGARAGGQARAWDLHSFSLADLAYWLGERPPADPTLALAEPEAVDQALDQASWVIVNMLSGADDRFGTDALRLVLDRHPERLQGKTVVVFAFDVPYELDATDLSKIDLFYALFALGPSFVDAAARLLYQELSPGGHPPVSVAGVGYDLLEVLSPDPDQRIPLQVRPTAGEEAGPTPQAGFNVGDTVFLVAGPILDRNGRPVPDGTPVDFHITYPGESLASLLQSTTVEGVAQSSVRLDRTGLLSFRVTSDPARVSDIVQLDVEQGVPAFATVIAPTVMPSPTPSITETAAPTGEPDGPLGDGPGGATAGGLPPGAFLLGVLLAGAGGGGVALRTLRRGANPRDAARTGVIGATGALLGYDYLALGLPGTESLRLANPYLALALFCAVGGAVGAVVAVEWWKRGWKRLG